MKRIEERSWMDMGVIGSLFMRRWPIYNGGKRNYERSDMDLSNDKW